MDIKRILILVLNVLTSGMCGRMCALDIIASAQVLLFIDGNETTNH